MRISAAMILVSGVLLMGTVDGEERQLTFSPQNHDLDNNDNFSPDGRFLCYDTRETIGPGIDNGQSIEIVEIATGKELVLYRPVQSLTGKTPAPGIGAASFSGASNRVAFIHGPPLETIDARGPYGKPNRNGAEVEARLDAAPIDGAYPMTWLDLRDIATDRETTPGAHRGGSHRHEYTGDGSRIGFTYDDFLLPEYDRTVGYMEPHPKAPAPASHYFALLVPVVPKGTARAGEIEKAYGDSWVGRDGRCRAFIGKVRKEDGAQYEESLFVAEIPEDVDITTADSGGPRRFPAPPLGIRIRRITHTWASGTVRGSPDGSRIAYYGKAKDGSDQVFVIPSDGSDRHKDPAKRPVQVTRLPEGVEGSLRWHPSGNTIFCISDNAVVATRVKEGKGFGEPVYLCPRGGDAKRIALAVSPDGKRVAYDKPVPMKDDAGKAIVNYAGEDFRQIFLLDFPGGAL